MFCSNCGTQMPDTSKFCTNCGAVLGAIPSTPADNAGAPDYQQEPSPQVAPVYQQGPSPQVAPVYQQGPAPQVASPDSGAKKNSKRIILICVIVAAVVVGLLVFLYSQGMLPGISGGKEAPQTTSGDSNFEFKDEGNEVDLGVEEENPIGQEDISVAYKEYLDVLTDEKAVIDEVGNQNLHLQVSFINVDDDIAPMMVVEGLDIVQTETDDSGKEYHYYENHLRAYLYESDTLWRMFDKSVWFSEWGMNSCAFFRTNDGTFYYAHWEGDEGGCHLLLEEYDYSKDAADLFLGSTWRIDFVELPVTEGDYPNHTDVLDTEHWRDHYKGSNEVSPPEYSKDDKVISQADFFSDVDEIFGSIDEMLINNLPGIDIRPADGDVQKNIDLKSYKTSSMSYADAIKMLNGMLAE